MHTDPHATQSASTSEPQDDSPKFGRLLLVLAAAVLLVVGITFASQAYYS